MRQKTHPSTRNEKKKHHCSQQNLLQNLPWNFGIIFQGPFRALENSPVLIGSPNGQGILVVFHDTAVDEWSLELESLFLHGWNPVNSPVELGSLSHELQVYSKASRISEPSTVGIQAHWAHKKGICHHPTPPLALYTHYESGCLHQKAGMPTFSQWITTYMTMIHLSHMNINI